VCVCGLGVCEMEINSGKCIYHFDEFHLEQERQCTCKPDIQARSLNRCFRGKSINITYSECVFVAIIIHHAMRMHRVLLLSVACPAFLYYLIKNGRIFGTQMLLKIKCVLTLYTNSTEIFFILRRIGGGIIINWGRYYHKLWEVLS
jgi:hypothetical protein